MEHVLALVLTGAVSMAALVYFHILGPRLGLVDEPTERRKIHHHAVPTVGGLAIFAAIIVSAVVDSSPSLELGYGLLGAAVLVIVGLIDDRFGIPFYFRFVAQIVAVLILATGGGVYISSLGDLIGTGPIELGVLALPFTVFAAVGIINAFNMIDGIDGLAGGLALIALTGCLLVLPAGSSALGFLLPVVIVATIPFLHCNLRAPGCRRHKVFLGDAGSLLLGYVVVWALINTSQAPGGLSPAAALWLVAVPLMDTLSVMGHRLALRHSPFKADRGHLHQSLTRMIGSQRAALVTILMMGLSGALVGLLGPAYGVADYALFTLALGVFTLYVALQRRIPHVHRFLQQRRHARALKAANASTPVD
jgi:UDP-GlcNAc:undecaprenyl-phosphate GlcNAc-1-phosphate transferase